ncbi:hypothetical protein DITRI_Ditri20bG0018500 [Diplodiscus trichospermus]
MIIFLQEMSSDSASFCSSLTSCQAWEIDLQYPEDDFWPSQILEINVKATFMIPCKNPDEEEEEEEKKIMVANVQEECHKLPLDQLLNYAMAKDCYETNIWDVFDSMQIPIQRCMLDKVVGCALGMAAMESYRNRKVLRIRVEVEALVDEQTNLEEEDAYCIDVEADDFWETVGAFRKLRKVVVDEPESAENVCSICLGEFLVGSEISATPCSHVFHDRCIRSWLKKCRKKFCPNCVTNSDQFQVEMSNATVCVRFRPLSSMEKRDLGDNICIQSIDSETFIIKDEKQEGFTFSFDKVFYEKSKQADIYEFLVLPIVRDAFNAINGTIIAYGQTGAGKTYSMEGPNILEFDEQKKGILPRVVDGLFECIRSSNDSTKYTIKLSMVEIYMEKVRDLFDLSKDNIQIKESRTQGILLSGATEIFLLDPAEALQSLSSGIANRAIGETQMNMASSRSHCVYMFTLNQESTTEKRVKSGKLILVDLAGSEKVEKTGAEGRVLEEAKTINKSLSALGNVINALTCGSPSKANHIPYRDSKLTRILQDALGGSSRTALLCCCSPSPSNASESLSTLRFGARAKHIKASPLVRGNEEKCSKKNGAFSANDSNEPFEKILKTMSERLNYEDLKLLEELFIQAGLLVDPDLTEDVDSAFQDVVHQAISSLTQAVEEHKSTVEMLQRENNALKERLAASERLDALPGENGAPLFLECEAETLCHSKMQDGESWARRSYHNS